MLVQTAQRSNKCASLCFGAAQDKLGKETVGFITKQREGLYMKMEKGTAVTKYPTGDHRAHMVKLQFKLKVDMSELPTGWVMKSINDKVVQLMIGKALGLVDKKFANTWRTPSPYEGKGDYLQQDFGDWCKLCVVNIDPSYIEGTGSVRCSC
jgi:hypothetical protein